MGVQYRLLFEELFGDLPVPTFIVISWSIHQTCSLGFYPHCHFGHRLESGELGGTSYLRVVIAGPHSSIKMLEVNSGLGSNGRPLPIALYA